MKDRLVGRVPTHGGAALIAVGGLFVGILLAQTVVRVLDLQGGGALVLEVLVLAAMTAGVWVALPDRFFTPWEGFYSRDETERWESPTERRNREDAERADGDVPDPRAGPADDGPRVG